MYLTDLTDAQKEYIKGTLLMDNWRSKFAWLENFRGLCRNYEERTESANEMLMVAAVVITLRKLTSVNNRF